MISFLNSETFDPTSFDSDYTLIVWFDNVNKFNAISDKYHDKEDINVYGIDINNEDNHCMADYYNVDLSKGYYCMLYSVSELVLNTNDIDLVYNTYLEKDYF